MNKKLNPKLKYFKSRDEWHEWLYANAQKEQEIWLLYYKKGTGKPVISYNDAVEEALCFGWIDGQVRSIDAEKYMQRYTPRRVGSVWSEINLARVKKMIAAGKMTEAGMKAAEPALTGKIQTEKGSFPEQEMPVELEKELRKDSVARDNFDKFAPSVKRTFYYYITSAKKPETKERRIHKTVKAARDNNKFGYMGGNNEEAV